MVEVRPALKTLEVHDREISSSRLDNFLIFQLRTHKGESPFAEMSRLTAKPIWKVKDEAFGQV